MVSGTNFDRDKKGINVMATKGFRIENTQLDKRQRAKQAQQKDTYIDLLICAYMEETKKAAAIYNEAMRIKSQNFGSYLAKLIYSEDHGPGA